ncbi:MAG: Tm-1-like ATP-binding domain-containing protein [Pirellulales bacterium]
MMNIRAKTPAASGGSVFVVATLDTKGHEAAFVRDLLMGYGIRVQLVDAGCLAPPVVPPDVDRREVFAAAGEDVEQLAAEGDRGAAVSAAARAAAAWMARAGAEGIVAGVLAIGGSAGTTIGTAAMRALPIGVPKVMVSTLASGEVRHYVGDKDILMLNSIVDIAGLNRVTREVLGEAARAMAGMVTFEKGDAAADARPLVAATMFGVTTPCVERAKAVIERAGYEVLVFHATGSGGQAMESLVRDGLIAGVLDITTTELADELVGGVLSAGPERLSAAAQRGVPQVVSVGGTDMVNFHAPETVPEKFRGRNFYRHNPNVTLMRTTAEECARIGADIGAKLSAATGPVSVLLPSEGVSAIDRAGQPFDDPGARRALFEAIRAAGPRLDIRQLDHHINDPEFATALAERLLELMPARTPQPGER